MRGNFATPGLADRIKVVRREGPLPENGLMEEVSPAPDQVGVRGGNKEKKDSVLLCSQAMQNVIPSRKTPPTLPVGMKLVPLYEERINKKSGKRRVKPSRMSSESANVSALPLYDNPMFSKSLTMTATCARFAASATRVKSLRKASVEGGGAAACFDCWRGATAGAEEP